MAKRLTDTEKWNDDWYISLTNDYRIIWQWLLDNCNHAGICKRSIRLLNLMCNTEIGEDELVLKMDGRLISDGNNWFIPKFIKFQYPTLHSHKPVIVSVVNELFKYNYHTLIPESFGNDYLIIKDKSKSKDKDINTDGGVGEEKKYKTKTYAKDFKVQREQSFFDGVKRRAEELNGTGKNINPKKTDG